MARDNAVTLRLGVEGDERVLSAIRKIGQTSTEEFKKLPKEAREASLAVDRLERSLDPLTKSAHEVAKAFVAAEKAVATGARTHEEAARVIDLAAERHRRLTQGLGENAKATALARHEWVNLGRQMTDVGTSLAGGASPFMVLTQQGGQIADVFASSRGGAAAAMKEFGGAVLSFALNPATLLAATVATLATGAHSAAGRLAEMADAAKLSGLEVNTLMGGRVIGARVGLDAEKSQGALTNAAQEFEAFKRNEGQIKQMLEKLGGGLLDVADKARTAGQFIDAIGGMIRNLPVTEGRDLAEKLFGSKEAASRLFDRIRDGSLSMAELAKTAGDASNALGPAAKRALELKLQIAAAAEEADNRLLRVFGDLYDPVAKLHLLWVEIKGSIAGAAEAAKGIKIPSPITDLQSTLGVVGPIAKRLASRERGWGELTGETADTKNALFQNGRIGNLVSPAWQADRETDLLKRLTSRQFNAPNIATLSEGESAGEARARYVMRDEKPMKAPKAARLPHIASTRASREKRDPIADMIGGLEDDRAFAAAELSTATATNTEREKARALVAAENVARREGVTLSTEQRMQIEGIVGATQQAKTSAELLAASSREVLDTTRDIARETLGGVVNALRQGKDMGEQLAGVLDRVLGKLLNIATDKTIDTLLGKSGDLGGGLLGGGGGGGVGSFLSGLFSFAAGGVMSSGGSIPLQRYAGGGVANKPQLALFGEGRQPEAFVPLPDGRRIPVALQNAGGAGAKAAGQAAQRVTIHNYAAGVEVTPSVSLGEVQIIVQSAIKANNATQAQAPLRGF